MKSSAGRKFAALMIAIGAVMAMGGGGAVANEEPDVPNLSDEQLMERQEPLLEASDRIYAISDLSESGFAGMVMDVEAQTVHLHWKGEIPESVRGLIDSLDASPERRIIVHAAAYTENTLTRESERLIGEETDYGDIVAVSPRPDGSGLDVTVDGTGTRSLKAPTRAAVPHVDDGLPSTVPVLLELGKRTETASRKYDSTPFAGGAQIWHNRSGNTWMACSDSFTVKNVSGETRMLTAAHCADFAAGKYWVAGDGQTPMGHTEKNSTNYDSILIKFVTNSKGSASVYTGGVESDGTDASNAVYRGVRDKRMPVVGAYVCTNGAYSGTRCGGKVQKTNTSIESSTGHTFFGGAIAAHPDKKNMVGYGDSGGGALTVNSDGSVSAVGGVLAGFDPDDKPATCTGGKLSGRVCSYWVFFTQINQSLSATGTTLATR